MSQKVYSQSVHDSPLEMKLIRSSQSFANQSQDQTVFYANPSLPGANNLFSLFVFDQ